MGYYRKDFCNYCIGVVLMGFGIILFGYSIFSFQLFGIGLGLILFLIGLCAFMSEKRASTRHQRKDARAQRRYDIKFDKEYEEHKDVMQFEELLFKEFSEEELAELSKLKKKEAERIIKERLHLDD